MNQHEDLAAYFSRCRMLMFVKSESYRIADEEGPLHTDEFHTVLFVTGLNSNYLEYINTFKNKVGPWPMPTRTRPTSLWEGPSTEELRRTRRSETFSRPVGLGERVPEVEVAEAVGARAELRREDSTPPAAIVRGGQALPIGIGRAPRVERGVVPYKSTVRDTAAVTTAGRRAIMHTSVRGRRGRTHLRVTLPRKSKSLT